ncbi:Dph6-related ATP pyrophosphatase [Falsibacillus albus]|nr:diphthine--ammonia ligase [Falsibacillus albus]
MEKKAKKTVVCWSGGKDCCLALHRTLQENHEVICLLSMVSDKDERNHAHGLKLKILSMQAEALGIPLLMIDSAGEYEKSLKQALTRLKEQQGAEAVVFGSLYAREDRDWNENAARQAGLEPMFPIWIQEDETSRLLQDFISLGYKSIVCRAHMKHFDSSWAGRYLDERFYSDIHHTQSCVMGENGEYHTFVLDGPKFHKRLTITASDVVLNSDLWSLDIQACELKDQETRHSG